MGFYKYNCNCCDSMGRTTWFIGGCLTSCGMIVAYNTFADNASWAFAKIAVVNYETIASSLPEYYEVNKRIESKNGDYKKKVEDFQKAQKEYEDNRDKMSNTDKSAKEKALKEEFMKIREVQQKLENEIEREIQPIRKKSKDAVMAFAKRNDIDIVFDIMDTTLVNDDLDITNRVIIELEKKNESKKK